MYVYASRIIGPCDIFIGQPPQSHPPWPKRCMHITEYLSLFPLVVAGIISYAVLSRPTGSCRSGQNPLAYLASTFHTHVGRDWLVRLERLNVQLYWSALSV